MMKYFEVKGLAANGVRNTFLVVAPDESSAIRECHTKGYTPLDVSEQKTTFWNREIVTKGYKRNFLQSLFFNIEAGITASKALELVVRSEVKPAMQRELLPALVTLERGGTFSEAVKTLGFFEVATIAILVSGERTGDIKNAVLAALEHYENANNSMKAISALVGLLSFDLFMTVGTSGYVQFQGIPYLKNQGVQNATPEQVERFYTYCDLALIANGALLFLGIFLVVVFVALVYYSWAPSNWPLKKETENFIQKLPGLRQFFQDSAVADSFGVAATMLKGGVGLAAASAIAKSASIFPFIKEYWSFTEKGIQTGIATNTLLCRDPLMDSERIMITAHRDMVQLARVFSDIGSMRQKMSAYRAKKVGRNITYGSLIYGGVSTLLYLGLLFLQNESLMSTLKS